MDEPIPCLIDAPHAEHDWSPLVADPQVPRVLHVGMADIRCPGVSIEQWLKGRDEQ